MAPSFDCGVLSLLCAEENDSIYYDDDADLGVVEEFETTWHHRNSNQKHSFKGEEEESMSGVPLQSDECLSLMLKNEFDHLPAGDYLKRLRNGDLDLGARQEAVDWMRKSHIKRKWVLVGSFVFPVMLIVCMCFYFTFDISPTLLLFEIGFQVHAHFSFGPLCAYLSVNYLDRFHSAYDLPKGKTWMMQLLAVACLSLAAKMEETEVPLCLDLQVCESKFVFEARTIQRMELLVLSTLKWRMQAITPFSFIDCFLAKINGDQISSRLSIFRSTQLILSIIKGIDFLEFRLSEIAASVAMSVAGETQTVDTENTLYELIPHLQKERVIKCVELMNKLSSLSGTTDKGPRRLFPSSVPQSPIGVLDAACLSYRTDDSTVGSRANSSHYNPDTKRRKLNRPFELEL